MPKFCIRRPFLERHREVYRLVAAGWLLVILGLARVALQSFQSLIWTSLEMLARIAIVANLVSRGKEFAGEVVNSRIEDLGEKLLCYITSWLQIAALIVCQLTWLFGSSEDSFDGVTDDSFAPPFSTHLSLFLLFLMLFCNQKFNKVIEGHFYTEKGGGLTEASQRTQRHRADLGSLFMPPSFQPLLQEIK